MRDNPPSAVPVVRMFNRSNLLIVAVAILGAVLGLLAGGWYRAVPERAVPTGVTVLQRGDQRADLKLPDPEGKPRRLSEWDGQVVLVNFWATWCGPCRQEMPLLEHAGTRWADKGLQVVGVAIDDAEAVRTFLKDYPVRYPIMVDDSNGTDPSLIFGDTRGVLPFSVLIGRDGRVLDQRAGSFSQASLTSWLQPHLSSD
jgi:thiol-disulfide isomerase/thioredoxin